MTLTFELKFQDSRDKEYSHRYFTFTCVCLKIILNSKLQKIEHDPHNEQMISFGFEFSAIETEGT